VEESQLEINRTLVDINKKLVDMSNKLFIENITLKILVLLQFVILISKYIG